MHWPNLDGKFSGDREREDCNLFIFQFKLLICRPGWPSTAGA